MTHSSIEVGHIYAIKDAICQYPANLPDMSLQNVTMDSQCFLEGSKGYMSLTFSAQDRTLYYSENATKSIHRVNLQHGASPETIMRGVGSVEGNIPTMPILFKLIFSAKVLALRYYWGN